MGFDNKILHAVNALILVVDSLANFKSENLSKMLKSGEIKILLAKRSQNELKEKGKWSIPGGKVEEYSFVKALRREIKEELNIILENENVTFFTFLQAKRDNLTIQGNYYICYIDKKQLNNIVLEEEEISDWKLFDVNEDLLKIDFAFTQVEVLRKFLEEYL